MPRSPGPICGSLPGFRHLPLVRNRPLLTLVCDQLCGQSPLSWLGLVSTNTLACSAPSPGRKCSEVPLKGTGLPCYWLDGRPRFLSWDVFQGKFLPLCPLSLVLFLAKAIWQKDMAQKHFLSHPGHGHCSPWVWGLGWHVGWGGHWDGLSPSLAPKHQEALNSRGNLGEL